MAGAWRPGLSIEDVVDWPNRIKAVTVDDVRKVAQDYLVDEKSVRHPRAGTRSTRAACRRSRCQSAGKDKS